LFNATSSIARAGAAEGLSCAQVMSCNGCCARNVRSRSATDAGACHAANNAACPVARP
jgi:hypothetical protein